MSADHSKVAAFVLSHGRPREVITVDTLRKAGWTRPVYVIVDNEDPTAPEYRALFGADRVVEFDKAAIAATFDEADTRNDRRSIVYARNACWEIARDLDLDYHIQLDDDYHDFLYRFLEGDRIGSRAIRSMDDVVDALMTFLDETDARTVAFSQGGDHMGGVSGPIRNGMKRKAMNSFVLRTDRPFQFVGRLNEDVNTYVVDGARGGLFVTILGLQLNQAQTQSRSGGMTDIYLSAGTYSKSFYSVLMAPSCVTIRTMGRTDRRLHHSIRWNNAVPKIVAERYSKRRRSDTPDNGEPNDDA
jgi:hypothetical protein